MNYLSLFSGVEGGGLAFQHLIAPKINCIGYVEINEYCQKVIAQRQKDELLSKAPIFTNIKTFIDSGCAKLYSGITDLVTAGFPCQPFSIAGKQKGKDDERNLWPATLRTIEIIRPRFVFLENVPGLFSSGYFGEILCGLFEAGYDARWCLLSARDCGAPHKRKRLWIFAYSKGIQYKLLGSRICSKKTDVIRQLCQWRVESYVDRTTNGLADRMDRLKAVGNGQVSIVAATAWEILTEGILF